MPTKKQQACAECTLEFLGPDKQRFCSQVCAKESRKKRKKITQCVKCRVDVECHVQGVRKYCTNCNPKPACASSRGAESYKLGSHVQLVAGGYQCKICEKVCKSIAILGGHVRIHYRTWDELKGDGTRKRWLITEHGHKCWICQNSEWMGKPIPLELDHIDGNSTNSDRLNLRIVCPNCHAQTPTYKAKNKGNGSKTRQRMYESMKLRASGI